MRIVLRQGHQYLWQNFRWREIAVVTYNSRQEPTNTAVSVDTML